jgi:hypothetical protein
VSVGTTPSCSSTKGTRGDGRGRQTTINAHHIDDAITDPDTVGMVLCGDREA